MKKVIFPKSYVTANTRVVLTHHSRTNMRSHIITHSTDKTYVCAVEGCGRQFKRHHSLAEHTKYIHTSSTQEVTCDWPGCDFKSLYVKNVKDHKKSVHLRDEISTCEVCGKEFYLKKSLTKHMKIHLLDRPQLCQDIKSCEWPGCSFVGFPSNLCKHRKTHLDYSKREFPCTWPGCDKRFYKKWNLDTHLRIHNNDLRYVCDWPGCTYRCADPCNLSKHIKRHHS
jgi:uncharacterized Zn-finger protein